MKFRTLIKVLGGIVALIILALLALPFFISAEYLKGQLVAQVKAATGRDLVIKGNASLKIFPNIAVSVEEVTLGNPAGFTTPYLVSIRKLETGAALKPLLAKELRITGLTLEGAMVNLEENASGAKNWEFPSNKTAQAVPPNAPNEAKASPLKALEIGDVVLKESAITYLKAGAKPLIAKDINLTLSGADGSKPLKLDADLNYQNEKVSATLAVEKMKALMEGKSSPLTLALDVPSTRVKFDGTVSNDKEIAAAGVLDVTVDDLPNVTAWATGNPVKVAKKIALKAKLGLKGTQQIALDDLTASADALAVTGKLAVNLAGAVPAISGALRMDELNLDTLGGKQMAAAQAKPATTAGQEGWSNARIDLSGLRVANAKLDLSINTLRSGKVEVRNIATNLLLNGGVMKLNLSNAALYNGTAKGAVTLDASAEAARIATNLALTGIEIDPLMTALSGQSRLEGKTNLNLNVAAAGASQRALVSALGGTASLAVADGALKGLNIASFVRDAKKGFLAESSTEKTDFSELTASFKIAQGVVSNDDLSLKSPILRVGGKGTVNLPPKTVNYRLEPTLVASMKGQGGKDKQGLTIPLVIAGPWSNPSITPDLAGMVQDALKDPEAFKQNLKDLNGTIKQFNSPKDIGKALLGGGAKQQAAPAAASDAAPATAPAEGAAVPATQPAILTKEQKKEQKRKAIEEGIGGLLNGLNK